MSKYVEELQNSIDGLNKEFPFWGNDEKLSPLFLPLTTLANSFIREYNRKFKYNDRVTKIKGSNWTGRVVGFYSASLTPMGYAVESETERGSVQIYPEAALELCEEQ